MVAPESDSAAQILERLLLEGSYQHVVYIGDGRNDMCPCTRLGPQDAILARSQVPADPLHCWLLDARTPCLQPCASLQPLERWSAFYSHYLLILSHSSISVEWSVRCS